MGYILDNDVKFLTGVGERRALLLQKELGIRTLGDLLYYFPFRYIDRSRIWRIGEIADDSLTYIQLRARITGFQHVGSGPKKRFIAVVADGSGTAELVWFKGINWIEKRLEAGREYIIFGRPAFFNGALNLVHPEVESVLEQANRFHAEVQGVYSTTEKLNNGQLGTKAIYTLMCNLWPQVEGHLRETLPGDVMSRYGLVPLRDALYNIHFPTSQQALRAAEYRLKFEELFGIQLNILREQRGRKARNDGFLFPAVGRFFNGFYNEKLPFPLTGAQKRVIREIRQDTVTGHQMNRLLQGDVGSGKTLVALMSMLLACDNGFQACLMAPTEILATQHHATLLRMLDGLGVRVELLTGSTRKSERTALAEDLLSGDVHILVGTHALIEDTVQFKNLGFVVIDEQHRFGVEQRARLWNKNRRPPHVLVMTATPIPRTLAMTLYGDLDVSVIDELPPGRKPIITYHVGERKRQGMYGFIGKELAQGHQAYVVCPLIEESEKMDLENASALAEKLAKEIYPQYQVGLLHGKMTTAEKMAVMEDFRSNKLQILVSTTVIEVGVDVPNANIMVIENAERFGLAQLHQLRGRVGRGSAQSYCILMAEARTDEAKRRMDIMVKSSDGFVIAEEDLALRGPGEVLGVRQSGLPDFKIADLVQDIRLLERSKLLAADILQDGLEQEKYAPLRERIDKVYQRKVRLKEE